MWSGAERAIAEAAAQLQLHVRSRQPPAWPQLPTLSNHSHATRAPISRLHESAPEKGTCRAGSEKQVKQGEGQQP